MARQPPATSDGETPDGRSAHSAALFALSFGAVRRDRRRMMQQRATHRIADASVAAAAAAVRQAAAQSTLGGGAPLLLLVSIALQAAALDRGSVLLVQALLVLSLLFALPISARLVAPSRDAGREWVWAHPADRRGDRDRHRRRPAARSFHRIAAAPGPPCWPCWARCWPRAWWPPASGPVPLAAALFAFVSGTLWADLRGAHQGRRPPDSPKADGRLVRTPELYAWAAGRAGRVPAGSSRRSGRAP